MRAHAALERIRWQVALFDRYGAHATFFVNGALDGRTLARMRTYQSYGHSVGLHGAQHVRAFSYIAEKGRDAWYKAEIAPQLATLDAAFTTREKLAASRVIPGMGFGSQFPGIAEDFEKGLERLAARNEALVLYSHDIKAKGDGDSHNTSLDVLARILEKAHALGVAVIGFDEL